MSYWVYIHTCKVNGKKYVGCTTRVKPEFRWGKNGEGYQTNKHFYSAILKYGWNNFQHEAWELTCESEMYYAEKYLIAYYNTTDKRFGYNHSTGGEHGHLGCKHSEETRKKMSQSMKGKHHKPFSEETKKKMSESRKKSHSDPEFRRKMAEIHTGKPHSEETKRKMSQAAKERAKDPEVRRKMSEVAKKKASDPEYRKKLSEAHKKKWLDPEFKERMSKVHSDPEVRRKQSEAAKNRPKIKIKLPDGTIRELTKNAIVRHYINKGKKFEYVD